jgi:putative colanic acid biosynthesis glycosyltransferase
MTSKQPQFTIITVVYNDVAGLVLTKSSIASQTFSDFEWIVIDGGSSDGTVNFLEQCDQIGLCWVSEKDNGIYDAMNKGINKSRGEYLVFLNAGDTFPSSDTLFSVYKALLSATKPDVLFGGAEYVFPDGKSLYRPPKVISKCIWHGLPANHQATYYNRNILNGLLYDPKYKICGDYYLTAKLYKKGFKAAYLETALVKFGVGGASYVNRIPLFLEPYLIQRDVLLQPLFWRIVSFLKRGISTLGMVVLQNIHRAKRSTQHGA